MDKALVIAEKPSVGRDLANALPGRFEKHETHLEGEETRIKEAARADGIVERVSGKDGVVDSVERKEQSERSPLLYDLTSLQRDANRRFGFSARRTLQAAQ